MKKKLICAGLAVLMMAALAACSNAQRSDAESSVPETYNANTVSVEDGAGSEYEISDMLPRPSNDTFVISVEEAEALMNKNVNEDNDAE